MDPNKDYYALYLKYKAKYLALKTGGAETKIYYLNKKGKPKDHPYTFYLGQTGEIEKDSVQYRNEQYECSRGKSRECNEDEVIKFYDDKIFNNPEYTKIYNSYPSRYRSFIEKLNKGAIEYIRFVKEQIKKNKDCVSSSMFTLTNRVSCDAKMETIFKSDNRKLLEKLNDEAKTHLESLGYKITWYTIYKYFLEDMLKNPTKYDNDPSLVISRKPFDPTNMSKGEIYKNIISQYRDIISDNFF